MEKRETTLEQEITINVNKLLEKSINKEILVVGHFDCDGITSSSIIIKALKRLDKKFSVKILTRIEEDSFEKLPKDKIIIFLDLASGSLDKIQDAGLEEVFIIDHHELTQEIPSNVNMVNPQLHDKEKISSSGLAYLFAKELDPKNKDLAKIAVLGMIGDQMDDDIEKLNHDILKDGEVQKKRGLMIYPSTRPLNRVLEFCSNPYIPGVTGDTEGTLELLREANLNNPGKAYPNLIDLTEDEMEKLVTAIMLRNPKVKNREIIGNIFLIKLYNKLEDARELTARINACSRMGSPETALQLCMEIPSARKKSESLHTKYRQNIISGLKHVKGIDHVEGKGFSIINAKDNIRDTIIGTITSILSNSMLYEDGTILIGMAYYDDKIKVSARNVGRIGRNVREPLDKIVTKLGGEVGGHKFAAGCMIKQSQEEEFIEGLKKHLEIEMVKI